MGKFIKLIKTIKRKIEIPVGNVTEYRKLCKCVTRLYKDLIVYQHCKSQATKHILELRNTYKELRSFYYFSKDAWNELSKEKVDLGICWEHARLDACSELKIDPYFINFPDNRYYDIDFIAHDHNTLERFLREYARSKWVREELGLGENNV